MLLINENTLFHRLIKHAENLLDEKEEKLCVKILKTLGEMMTADLEYGEKVSDYRFYDV